MNLYVHVHVFYIFQTDTCYIGGQCLQSGHVFDQDPSRVCMYLTNRFGWTEVNGSSLVQNKPQIILS